MSFYIKQARKEEGGVQNKKVILEVNILFSMRLVMALVENKSLKNNKLNILFDIF